MTSRLRFGLAALAASFLAACVTAVGTPYGPADSKGFGYSERRIEDNRFRVVFAGDGATSAVTVEDFAIRRAAELAVQNGYDWFLVAARDVAGESKGGVGVGAGLGTGSFGRRGGVSVGVGGDLGRVGARRFFTARLEVLMGTGPTPNEPNAYNASMVLRTIAPSPGAPSPGAPSSGAPSPGAPSPDDPASAPASVV